MIFLNPLPRLWLAPLAALVLAAAPIEAPRFETRLAAAASLVDANKSDEALAVLDAVRAETELPLERGQVDGLRSFALARAGRIPEARTAIEAAIASSPAPTLLLLRQLFLLRMFDGDQKGAGDAVLLIAATDPNGLNSLPMEMVNGVVRAAQDDGARGFELDYALVTAGWSPPDATVGSLDWARLRLITGLVERDRSDEARAVLAGILNPVVLVRLGIDRRFAAFWPEIERRLGPGADTADAIYIAAAKARFDKQPDSLIARLGYAEALNVASRELEATKLLDVARSSDELARLTDSEIWLVNLHAQLLGDAGEGDAALARLAALNATPPNGRPDMIATIVSEVLLAQHLGRSETTLTLADAARAKLPEKGETAQLYLAGARACALADLGRTDAALAAAAPLIAAPAANDDAYLAAMICLGRSDAAAVAVVRRLADPAARTGMLFDLQPFLINDRAGVMDARGRAGLRALKARPDVRAAYLKAGRDLPGAVAPPR